jgi:hypothetical protein
MNTSMEYICILWSSPDDVLAHDDDGGDHDDFNIAKPSYVLVQAC